MPRKAKTDRVILPSGDQRSQRILLGLPDADERLMLALLKLGHKLNWDFVELALSRGFIPTDREPAGAIVSDTLNVSLKKHIGKIGCPVVHLDLCGRQNHQDLPLVAPDRAMAGRMAAQYFTERGFRNVAYEASVSWKEARRFYEGFHAEALRLGMHCDLLKFKSPISDLPIGKLSADEHDKRLRATQKWLAKLPKPIGIFSLSATTVCIACDRLGLHVPEEVSLLGAGNHELVCELSPVALSSIDMAQEDQGKAAVAQLSSLMAGVKAPAGPIVIPPKGVVERQSTNSLAISDRVVAKALSYMWSRLRDDISYDEIAGHAGISSRQLARRFKQALNRSIGEELLRKRLLEFKHLLGSSELPIADLGNQVGFRSRDYMHRTFRKSFGMTPGQYRRSLSSESRR